MAIVDSAGSLRHRVAIQSPTAVANEYGEPVNEWATVATVWASIKPLDGRELWQAKQVNAETTHRVTVRDSSDIDDIDASWRVVHDGRVLEIESVWLRDERRLTMLDLMCKETDDSVYSDVMLEPDGEAMLQPSGDVMMEA